MRDDLPCYNPAKHSMKIRDSELMPTGDGNVIGEKEMKRQGGGTNKCRLCDMHFKLLNPRPELRMNKIELPCKQCEAVGKPKHNVIVTFRRNTL